MEVLFAVAACLGAFALGAMAQKPRLTGKTRETAPDPEEELPPGLRRQWEDFLRYTGYPEGEGRDED